MYIQMFPEEFIQLQREVLNHPPLMEMLQNQKDTDAELQFSKCLAEIAAYVNVALDDHYTESDLRKVCDICIERLRSKRAEIVVTNSSGQVAVEPSRIILPKGYH